MNEKLCGALGLARRAGRLTVGSALVREQLRSGKAAVILLAADLSENAEKKLLPLAEHRSVKVVRTKLDKASLAAAIGAEGEVGAVSVSRDFMNLVLASL